MADNVIQVAITAQIGDLTSAMDAVAGSVQASTAAMQEGFASLAAASAESTAAIVSAVGTVEVAVEHEEETVSAKLTEMGAELTEFAEKAKLTSLSTVSAFGAIGAVLGGGIVVAALGEMIDKTRESVVETTHQAEAAGVTVAQLRELKDAFAEVGANSEGASTALKFLERSMSQASDGGKKQVQAFKDLGISADQVTEHLNDPIGMLGLIADGMQASGNASQRTADAMAILGRQGAALIGPLREGGDALREHMEAARADGEAAEQAKDAAFELTAIEAQLGRELRTVANESLPGVVTGLKYLIEGFYIAADVSAHQIDILYGIANAAQAVIPAMQGVWEWAKGNYDKADALMKVGSTEIKEAWRLTTQSIQTDLDATQKKIDALFSKKEHPPEAESSGDAHGHEKDNHGAQEAQIEGEKAHALAMLEIQKAFIEDNAKLIGGYDASKAQQLRNIADEELNITRDALAKKAALIASDDPEAPAKRQVILNQLQAAEDANSKARLSITETDAEARKKSEEAVSAATVKMLKDVTDAQAKESAKREELQLKTAESAIKAADTQIQAAQKHQDDLLAMERKRIDLSAQLGEISERQKITMTQATYDAEYAGQQRSIQREIDLENTLVAAIIAKRKELEAAQNGGTGTSATQQELTQLVSATEAANQKLIALAQQLQQAKDNAAKQSSTTQDQLVLHDTQVYKTMVDQVGSAFQSGVMSWVKGTTTLAGAFEKMGTQIVTGWISTLLTMGVKWAEQQALQLALHEATNLGLISQDTANALAGRTIQTVSGVAQVESAAAIAAANAFASTAAIPIIGLELAPAAAATAFGAVQAFLPGVSAAGGADLPNYNTLGFLHPREMVLPQQHADVIRGMANQSGNGGSAGGNFSTGDIHMHGTNITSNDLVNTLQKAHRNGAFSR